ncbi:MAG TPA: ketopantoate reductase family protein [Blastocatellia bacterium]|nr:ketopantoate reductase family protein [Blastocatellia bacterium]
MEKAARYVIFGAGAVGCAIGGLLAHAGARVICVARAAQAEALRRGITIRWDGREDVTVKTDAVTSLRDLAPEPGDVVIVTVKAQAMEGVIGELAAAYDATAPVVCLQNGVRNEEIAAPRFENVYAGLLMMTAVQLEPQLVTMPRGGAIAIGRYPAGVDAMARTIADDLARTGFEMFASAQVMAMKWGKLVTNLNNATHAITGYSMEKAMADPEMRRLMAEVREEGLRVLDAAGIEAEPPAAEPSPIRIRKSTEAMRRPPGPADLEKAASGVVSYPSMWQDLYLGRQSNEAELLNGEIVRLGREQNIPTPYNSTLLEIIRRMTAEGRKPGLYTPEELRGLIMARPRES